MTGAALVRATSSTERAAGSTTDHGHTQGWVEVALHRVRRARPACVPRRGGRANRRRSRRRRRCHQAEQFPGADPKDNGRHTKVGDPGEHLRVWEHELGVLIGARATGPTVEELHRLGARLNLGPQERDGVRGQARRAWQRGRGQRA